MAKSARYHHCGTSAYFFISKASYTSEGPVEVTEKCPRTAVMHIVDVLLLPHEPEASKRGPQVLPVPQPNVHEGGTQTEVVAHLADDVRRGIPGKANFLELGRVKAVVGCEDRSLIVRVSVGAEERGGHELEVAAVEGVAVVREGENEVADGHADYEKRKRVRGIILGTKNVLYELISVVDVSIGYIIGRESTYESARAKREGYPA